MTPEQHREYAANLIRLLAKVKAEDKAMIAIHSADGLTAMDVDAVAHAMRTANVEITWPDPCPACGVLGCTEHPTWAAETKRAVCPQCEHNIEPELPEWERELLERQAAERKRKYGWSLPGDAPGLSPGQEIRLRLVEMFRSPTDDESTEDYVRDLLLCVSPLAAYVDTGLVPEDGESVEPDPSYGCEEPGCGGHFVLPAAGYAETFTVPGTTGVTVVTVPDVHRSDRVVMAPVVTAPDPGGLLNDQEFDSRVSAWQRAKGEGYLTPPEADEPVKQTAHPHSGTQTGSTGLTGGPSTPATAIPADGESGETP